MHNLSSLNTRLQQEFPRHRVRYSTAQDRYLIEYKMGTGYFDKPLTGDPDRDIQMKEGYIGWATITPGDRIGCYVCHKAVKVPVREFREFSCTHCGQTQPAVAYFDLNDDLLDHMRKVRSMNVTTDKLKSEQRDIHDRKHEVAVDNAQYVARENAWKLYGNPRNISHIDWHALDVNNTPRN